MFILTFFVDLPSQVAALLIALWNGLVALVQDLGDAVVAAVLAYPLPAGVLALAAAGGALWLERRQLRRVWARVQARAARRAG